MSKSAAMRAVIVIALVALLAGCSGSVVVVGDNNHVDNSDNSSAYQPAGDAGHYDEWTVDQQAEALSLLCMTGLLAVGFMWIGYRFGGPSYGNK